MSAPANRALARSSLFPPRPPSFRARGRELATLEHAARAGERSRVALVGAGGSGKSTLACALGHEVARHFPGGIHWFRVGAWDTGTLTGMLALHFGAPLDRGERLARLRAALAARGRTFIVLDNHENDRAVAALLDELRELPITWVITARRCLLAGVSLFPVIPPLITTGASPFPAVASLTRLLRWNPVALSLADAFVASGAITVAALGDWLLARGVDRVKAIAHEDDLPEVALLVDWAWAKLGPAPRRMLRVLGQAGGDHVDAASLAKLAKAGSKGDEAIEALRDYRLIQEPLAGRYALHATVRHAIEQRTEPMHAALFEHYVSLLEKHPERLELEQTHLFAAMDQAHDVGGLAAVLRVEELLARLEQGRGG